MERWNDNVTQKTDSDFKKQEFKIKETINSLINYEVCYYLNSDRNEC